MAETLLPQIQSPEARIAVIEAVLALFARWRLHDINQAQLLGVEDIAILKNQKTGKVASAVLTRAGNLLAIDRALNRYYAYQPRVCDQWISSPQEQLTGATPLAVMLKDGNRGIRKIRDLVESQLGITKYNRA